MRLADQAKRRGSKPRQERMTGAIDLKTKDERAPFEPPVSAEGAAASASLLPGFEREGIQLLYYHPQLIAHVIERGAARLWSQPLVGLFVDHLYERFRRSGYVASSRWLDERGQAELEVAYEAWESASLALEEAELSFDQKHGVG